MFITINILKYVYVFLMFMQLHCLLLTHIQTVYLGSLYAYMVMVCCKVNIIFVSFLAERRVNNDDISLNIYNKY